MDQQRKIKILMFHGYGTNRDIMMHQTLNWRKKYFKNAEFDVFEAPFEVDKERIIQVDPGLKEFLSDPNSKAYSYFNTGEWTSQLPEMLKNLTNYINKNGPFDGLMGFSMGGGVCHVVSEFFKAGYIKLEVPKPKFVIFCCSTIFIYKDEDQIQKYLSMGEHHSNEELASLHLLGENDFVFDRGLMLSTLYKNPLIILHNSGHKFPRLDQKEIERMKNFMNSNKIQGEDFQQVIRPKL